MIDLPPPGYEQTIQAIVRCDIPRANIRIAYEDELRSDEVTISNLGILGDEKLRCLKEAVHPFYILTIQDQAQQTAFYEFSRREGRPLERAKAREWVQSKKLIDKLPSFSPEGGLKAYVEALENACGLTRDSALTILEPSSLTVRPDFLLGNKVEKSAKAIECLMNMFSASDASEKGIRFGFIGNEALGEEKK